MTREIKFRAWDKDHKTMRYGILPWAWDFALLTGFHKCVRSRDEDGWARFEVNAITCDGKNVMQYTGLKDKNGKEIYEGDIVKVIIYGREYNIGEIIYVEDCCSFRVRGERFGAPLDGDDGDYTCEIIGNKFENPELLRES